MCLVAALAWGTREPPRSGFAGEAERARRIGWLLLTTSAVFVTSLALRSIDFICGTMPVGTRFFWHLLKAWCPIASIY
jgi:hypothetical protein